VTSAANVLPERQIQMLAKSFVICLLRMVRDSPLLRVFFIAIPMLFRFARGLHAAKCRAPSIHVRSCLVILGHLFMLPLNKAVIQAAYACAWLCNLVPAICDEISDY